MKHTPTPWMWTGHFNSSHVQKTAIVLQAKRVNAMNIAQVIPCMGMTNDEIKANAQRIVACVNALEGIRDPDHYIHEMKEIHKDRIKEVVALRQQLAQATDALAEMEAYKAKAEKWDALSKKISKCYCNKDGEYDEKNPETEDADLCTIGEFAASAFGWI